MNKDKTIYQRKFTKELPKNDRIVATFQLHQIGDQSPYFSLTADMRDAGGMLHEEIAEFFPELRKFLALHLSDQDGVPMHAVANAAYWAGFDTQWNKGKKNDPPNAQFLADHLRIDLATATEIVRRVANERNALGQREFDREDLARFVNDQKPRWKQEANEAIEFLKTE